MITRCSGEYDVEVIDDDFVVLHHKLDKRLNQGLRQDVYPVHLRTGYIIVGNRTFEILV